jgi:hypothetical protein
VKRRKKTSPCFLLQKPSTCYRKELHNEPGTS